MRYRFTDTEINKLLKNIVILVDTKEQNNFHILEYFKKHKRKYKEQSLKEGDLYMTNEILVERKGSLDEVAGNLCNRNAKFDSLGNKIMSENKERERFKFELTRIRNCNATLFLFIEDKNGNENIRKGNYRSEYTPEAFLGSIKSFEAEFKFSYKFLDKAVMGSEIFFTIYYHIRDLFKSGQANRFITIDEAEVEEVVGE